jgi:hypothetical protein
MTIEQSAEEMASRLQRAEMDLEAAKEQFESHTKAVSAFLSEMYATMVDPLADGSMSVKAMCALLINVAREQREQIRALIADRDHQRSLSAIGIQCPTCRADIGCCCDTFALENRRALFHSKRIEESNAAIRTDIRRQTLTEMIPKLCSRCASDVPLERDHRGILMHRYDRFDLRDCTAGTIYSALSELGNAPEERGKSR